PYKVASMWGGNRFDNAKLRSIGWTQLVSTAEGLQRTFVDLRNRTAPGSATNPNQETVADPLPPMANENASVGTREEFVVAAALGPDWDEGLEHLRNSFIALRRAGHRARLVIIGATNAPGAAWETATSELRPFIQWVPDGASSRDVLRKS